MFKQSRRVHLVHFTAIFIGLGCPLDIFARIDGRYRPLPRPLQIVRYLTLGTLTDLIPNFVLYRVMIKMFTYETIVEAPTDRKFNYT